MEDFVYKFIPFIPKLKVGVFGPQNASAISDQLEALVSQFRAKGWEYVGLEQVSVTHSAGCLASLFGASTNTVDYDLVVFRVPASSLHAESRKPAKKGQTQQSHVPISGPTASDGTIQMPDGRSKTITEMDIPFSLKSVYEEWAATPDDVAAWSRFMRAFSLQESGLPHGQGASRAVGSFFPDALDKAEFVRLLDRLES